MTLDMRQTTNRQTRSKLAIALAGLAAAGSLVATASMHASSGPQDNVLPATSRHAEPSALAPERRLPGAVASARHAQLTAAISARVESVAVSEGQIVEKGDVLLALDDADEALLFDQREADVIEARAALETLAQQFAADRRVLEHMRELHRLTLAKRQRLEGLASQDPGQLEDTRASLARQSIQLAEQQLKVDNHPQRIAVAEAALARAESLLAEQELRLSRTVVTAPFAVALRALQLPRETVCAKAMYCWKFTIPRPSRSV
ncbi:MAG: biotin/lipoyl-binding protein [Halieaceae bacterium]|jgi:multidrug efflux pump subunit AcrA (membrane-fusion protein)|nr:biotin/lipoyl-binding protein [Halieaceae bacterium]